MPVDGRVDVPVISVGNLTLGGTGKTPLVAWIAHWLALRQLRVTLISRGYGATAGSGNDERLERSRKGSRRTASAKSRPRYRGAQAIREHHCQVILLDDGFQHRRMVRTLDIVLIDAPGAVRLRPRLSARDVFASRSRPSCVPK